MAGDYSSLRINKTVKSKLQNLDFVRKHSDEKIIEELMNFYETHKQIYKKWKK